jgi:ABC-2 type transport system ATP-binding protein
METIVRLDQVTKKYGRLVALEQVTLSIGKGVTGLLGPNGAGKTTLIKVLLGLVRTSSGEGEVLGFRLKGNARKIRQNVGYMPEDDCYIAGLSGVELVHFMARLSGQAGIEGLRRAHEILDYCNIQQERYRDVATYSTGMRQKLKFAQAIVHDPPLLILDEPTAGLDPEERVAMLNRIRSLSTDAGKAVLISTHILPDVQAICDDVVIMVGGRVRVVERLAVLSRPSSPMFSVRLTGSVETFRERVKAEGYELRTGREGALTIHGLGEDAAEHIWRWSRETGVALRSMVPATNSLEDVFLQAIRESDVANS